ncbi:MAG: photosynthetic reaction center subunit H [Pseudomonadota bacterium]
MANNLVGSIDLVEILFTLFWLFFFGLVFYIQREGRREGFPVMHENPDGSVRLGPNPDVVENKKVFLPQHGGESAVPRPINMDFDANIAAKPAGRFPGAPYVPTGDPLVDGVGPAAWSEREDKPDLCYNGDPRIVPMRNNPTFHIDSRDTDPRGKSVITADGKSVGSVTDCWIDLPEPMIVYLEVALDESVGTGNVLVPFAFVDISKKRDTILVEAVMAEQFARAPRTKDSETVTLLEEDKIQGYFGGGKLLATPERSAPLI